ncbi:unnamed protein product [Lactuca saligna]|uniref:Uncharacterized protein n=1 Tax=Lactuca saligna TaxID=75948 RepID=A0AA35ZFH7_LACSI|nr:unnamed protein product [Lactuca saligna]
MNKADENEQWMGRKAARRFIARLAIGDGLWRLTRLKKEDRRSEAALTSDEKGETKQRDCLSSVLEVVTKGKEYQSQPSPPISTKYPLSNTPEIVVVLSQYRVTTLSTTIISFVSFPYQRTRITGDVFPVPHCCHLHIPFPLSFCRETPPQAPSPTVATLHM